MTQLPKKSLFAAYSNDNDYNDNDNNKNILSLEQSQPQPQPQQQQQQQQLSWLTNSSFKENKDYLPPTTSTTKTTTTTSPTSTTIKKRASDFFNLESNNILNNDDDGKKKTEPVDKLTLQPNKKQITKKRSFIDSSDSSDSSSSDGSNSDDDGFTYKRNKFKKEQEKERKREKREKKKKRKDKEKKYYSNDDRSIIVNELFEKKNKEDYYIETLGDKTNYTIGLNNKSLVPNYNYDNFKILGLNDCKIGYSKKDGFQIESLNHSSSSSKQLNRYFIKPTITTKETIEKVKPIPNLNDPSISNQDEIKLIVIDKNSNNNDGDNDGDDDDDDDNERKLLKKNSELNKLVEQYPNNEEYWIRLVRFQENFLQFSNRKGRSSKIAMYEKQLSIYRNALLVNTNSEILTIEYLKLASKIWDQQKVFDLWNKLIQKANSDGDNGTLIISENLWKEYVEFCLSNFNEFKVEKMKDTIISIIKKLLIKRRSFKIKTDTQFMVKVQQLEESILQFISQLTKFLSEAGFSERVIGIYQSLVEFNCFEPAQLSNETQATLLKEFKKYWSNNDYPKIGELNSIGWSKSYSKLIIQNIEKECSSSRSHNNNSGGAMNLDNLDNLSIEEIELLLKEQEDLENNENNENIFNIVHDTTLQQNGDENEQEDTLMKSSLGLSSNNNNSSNNDKKYKFNKWGNKEIEIGEINWKPLTIDDIKMVEKEVNEQDTERVVLFNDFYELLFRFVKEENKIELIFQFLEFLGVPIALDDKLPPRFTFNHPLRRESINSINENNVSLLFKDLKQQQQQQQQEQQPPPSSNDSATTTPNWFTTFDQISNSNKLSDDRIQFIELVYKQILENSNAIKSKEKLYISFILFKASIDIEEAKRYTKSLCEKFKQLIYFDIFAALEIKCGKIQEAKKIYQTTCQFINQLQPSASSSPAMVDLIYREYFYMELNSIYSAIEKDPQILKRFIKSGMKPIEMFTLPLHILQCYLDGNYKQYSSSTTITIDQRLNYLNFKFNQKLQHIIPSSSSHSNNHNNNNNNNNNNSNQLLTTDFILCYCIFQLLLNGFDGFIKSFKQFVDKDNGVGSGGGNSFKYFKEFSIEHELITVKSIEMVAKIAPLLNIEPWKIKNLIIESLDNGQYYDHPKLLTLFLNWESQNQLVNRVRIYFDLNNNSKINNSNNNNSSSGGSSVIFWLFSIKFESNRLGAAQRIKSLFERAIGSGISVGGTTSNCKHNILLWKLYIEFEVKRGRLKTAKSIYYRAIKELPWSKLIWLLPFTNDKLSSIFDENELTDIIKLINEKGIRLRIIPPL